MNDEIGTLDSLVQETIEADTDFQDSIVDMSDEDKETAISEKRAEVREASYKSLAEKAVKDAELAKNYKTRAEKAEGKKPGESTPKPDAVTKDATLSQKDVIFLAKTDVHDDDYDDVVSTATEKGISVKEAYEFMKPILDVRTEERKTADATNTSKARPGNKKVSGAQLTKDLSDGKVPQKGSQEAEDLFWERRGGKR